MAPRKDMPFDGVVYHCSNAKFDEFRIAENRGVYFANEPDHDYGRYIYKCHVKIAHAAYNLSEDSFEIDRHELIAQGFEGRIVDYVEEIAEGEIMFDVIAFHPYQINILEVVERDATNEALEWVSARASDVEVMIDVAKLEASFAKDANFYVGPQGEGGIKGRYERFAKWMEGGQVVEMPEVCMNGDEISFINGRHRFAWMRDHGVKMMPVAVPADCAAEVKAKFG